MFISFYRKKYLTGKRRYLSLYRDFVYYFHLTSTYIHAIEWGTIHGKMKNKWTKKIRNWKNNERIKKEDFIIKGLTSTVTTYINNEQYFLLLLFVCSWSHLYKNQYITYVHQNAFKYTLLFFFFIRWQTWQNFRILRFFLSISSKL